MGSCTIWSSLLWSQQPAKPRYLQFIPAQRRHTWASHATEKVISLISQVGVQIPAQVIVHILLQLRHLLLCNRRPCDQLGALPLLSFLLELYCVYQGNDSKAGYMWTYLCVFRQHTAMFNSYQLWLMNFSGFLPTMVSTTSILDQRNYKPIRFDLAWTRYIFMNQSKVFESIRVHQSFWLESNIYVVSRTNLLLVTCE